MLRTNVAILAGGYSGEADISLQSAQTILDHIDLEFFNPVLVIINQDEWIARLGDESFVINKHDFSFQFEEDSLKFDFVFIMVHGSPGENGLIQGYFDMLNIPYSTGDCVNMGSTFDKEFSQCFLRDKGFNVAPHVIIKADDVVHVKEILETVGLPCFVKPTQSGSSIGVSKVKSAEELEIAIDAARKIHAHVLVESFLNGRELACGVYENGDSVDALPVTEIVPASEFFDYNSKYEDSETKEITPAQIGAKIFSDCQELSKRIYKVFNCRGIVRIDYMLVDEKLFVIELNTVPGFSEKSLVPQQLNSAGINIKKLITQIIIQYSNNPSKIVQEKQ